MIALILSMLPENEMILLLLLLFSINQSKFGFSISNMSFESNQKKPLRGLLNSVGFYKNEEIFFSRKTSKRLSYLKVENSTSSIPFEVAFPGKDARFFWLSRALM